MVAMRSSAWELGSRPDVIVLDLMMPVLNGLEFLEVAAQRRALVGDSRHSLRRRPAGTRRRTSASTARSRSRSS